MLAHVDFKTIGLPGQGMPQVLDNPIGGPGPPSGGGTTNWCFDTDAMGLAQQGPSSVLTFGWLATDGVIGCGCSLANGCVQFLMNSGAGPQQQNAYRTATGQTWETWGAPVGSTVTSVQITCWAKKNAAATSPASSFQIDIIDSAGVSVTSLPLVNEGSVIDSGWTIKPPGAVRSVLAGKQASNTDVRLRLAVATNTAPPVDIRIDAIQLTLTTSGGTTLDLPPPDAFWRFEEASGTRTDSKGALLATENGGTIGNAAGLIGNGVSFSAAQSRYLSVNDAVAISANGNTGPFTMGFWFKLASTTTGYMIDKWNDGNNVSYEYRAYVQGIAPIQATFYVSSNGAGSGTIQVVHPTSISVGVWYCVLCWFDSTALTLNIQVNNGTITSTSLPNGIFDGVRPLFIGAQSAAPAGNYFDGQVDCLSFWHVLLTSAQRTAWYNSGAGHEWVSGAWSP